MATASEAAETILKTVWGDRGYPVDPITIARALGIEVLKTKLPENVSGAIIKEPGKDARILIEASDTNNRKRFTVAHELGHFFQKLEEGQDENFEYVDFRGSLAQEGTDAQEVFANQFAAALLMPEKDVKKAWRKHKSIAVLAVKFGVSVEAMRYRLRNLNIQ